MQTTQLNESKSPRFIFKAKTDEVLRSLEADLTKVLPKEDMGEDPLRARFARVEAIQRILYPDEVFPAGFPLPSILDTFIKSASDYLDAAVTFLATWEVDYTDVMWRLDHVRDELLEDFEPHWQRAMSGFSPGLTKPYWEYLRKSISMMVTTDYYERLLGKVAIRQEGKRIAMTQSAVEPTARRRGRRSFADVGNRNAILKKHGIRQISDVLRPPKFTSALDELIANKIPYPLPRLKRSARKLKTTAWVQWPRASYKERRRVAELLIRGLHSKNKKSNSIRKSHSLSA